MNVLKRIKNWLVPYSGKRVKLLEDIWLHFMDYNEVQAEWKKYKPFSDKKVNGFTINDDIYISWNYQAKDIDGEYLPNLECLGHEIYHHFKRKFHN